MNKNKVLCYTAGWFMVTWHQTMKLFPAKCPERATLRKLWRQTGNSSLLPTKCWPLLHVIRACSWRWPDVAAWISERFSKFAFVLFCYITNYFMTGKRWILFPSNINIFLNFVSGNIEHLGKHCFSRDQSLNVNCRRLMDMLHQERGYYFHRGITNLRCRNRRKAKPMPRL